MTRFTVVLASLAFAMGSLGCGSSSDPAATPSGAGTRANPYILEVGKTYSVSLVGMRNLCDAMNVTCADFDKDYTSLKGAVTQAGNYKVSFTNVDADRDLVVYAYKNDYGTHYTYVGQIDEEGKGGSEIMSGRLDATSYMMFLASWGGADTIDVTIEKLP